MVEIQHLYDNPFHMYDHWGLKFQIKDPIKKSPTSVSIPDTVTVLGKELFYKWSTLTEVKLLPKLTEISASTFEGCEALSSITIPDSVTVIGSSAFSGCAGLTKVTLPSHPIEYGSSAFESCPKLSLAVRKAITDSGYKGEF